MYNQTEIKTENILHERYYQKWGKMNLKELEKEMDTLINKYNAIPNSSESVKKEMYRVAEFLRAYIVKRALDDKLQKERERI